MNSGDIAGMPCIKGRCQFMCSEDEFQLRKDNKLIHVLETEKTRKIEEPGNIFNHKLTVKCFQRSAAGKDLCDESGIRPPEVLANTVNYLLTDLIDDKRVPWHEVCDFISDRLRAVRQDLVVQRASAEDSIKILEPMVRFHIYAAYRLSDAQLTQFDPKLNHDQIMDCLNQTLSLYDTLENDTGCKNRSEMETVYQIVNLGCAEALARGLSLDSRFVNSQLLTVMKISLSWYCKQYVAIFKKLKSLNLLLQIALVLKLPEIRRYALTVMSVAYNCKNATYPIEHLTELLLFDSELVATEECEQYNLEVSDKRVKFLRSSFILPKEEPVRRKVKFISDCLLFVNVSKMLLYAEYNYGNLLRMRSRKY